MIVTTEAMEAMRARMTIDVAKAHDVDKPSLGST